VFASVEAAEKYSRLLRRASWPLILPQPELGELLATTATVAANAANPSDAAPQLSIQPPPPSHVSQLSVSTASGNGGGYTPTPQTTPRRLALRARQSNPLAQQPAGAQEQHFFGDGGTEAQATGSAATAHASALNDANSPLVNLLLLGDESCGLGVALDEFAGRAEHNVGLTFKTRRIHLRASRGRDGSHTIPEQVVRVRCWHTPGLTPDTVLSLGPYLRRVQAVALIYDAASLHSFRACEAWATLLIAHAQAAHAAGSGHQRRPILLIGNTAGLRPGLVHAAHAVPKSVPLMPPVAVDPAIRAAEAVEPEPAAIAIAAAAQQQQSQPSRTASPALARVTRRRSLPHATNGAVPAVPISSVAPVAPLAAAAAELLNHNHHSDSHGSAGDTAPSSSSALSLSSAATSNGGGGGGGLVSSALVHHLLSRLSHPSACLGGGEGLVLARSLDACAWKERYVAFYTVAQMAAGLGLQANSSRPVSPVQR
jgi:hypothetical protein